MKLYVQRRGWRYWVQYSVLISTVYFSTALCTDQYRLCTDQYRLYWSVQTLYWSVQTLYWSVQSAVLTLYWSVQTLYWSVQNTVLISTDSILISTEYCSDQYRVLYWSTLYWSVQSTVLSISIPVAAHTTSCTLPLQDGVVHEADTDKGRSPTYDQPEPAVTQAEAAHVIPGAAFRIGRNVSFMYCVLHSKWRNVNKSHVRHAMVECEFNFYSQGGWGSIDQE